MKEEKRYELFQQIGPGWIGKATLTWLILAGDMVEIATGDRPHRLRLLEKRGRAVS